MKLLALLLAVAVAAPCRAQAPSPHAIDIPRWFTETFLELRDDVREAAAQGKRVMLYFGQDGCPYCTALMQTNFSQRPIADKTRRHFVAIALNLWGDREVVWLDGRRMSEKALGRELRVQFTPTLLFLDEQGVVALMGAKPVALLFETPYCAGCDELHREALQRPEVRRLLERFSVYRLTLNDMRTPKTTWARELRVAYTPTIVFLDRGKEVFRIDTYLRPFHLASALDYVASRAYRKEPSFQRYLQSRTERLRGRGDKVDLWN